MTKHKDPLKLIDAIRNSTPYMHVIYTNGSCWKFHEILKVVYPEAIPYYMYDEDGGHVLTKIGDKFYDINGVVDNPHNALEFNAKNFPRNWKGKGDWWCKFYTLAMRMEEIVMTKQLRRKFPM